MNRNFTNIKNFVLSFLLVLLAGGLVVLTGCGPSNPSPAKEPSVDKNKSEETNGETSRKENSDTPKQTTDNQTRSEKPTLVYYVMPG